MGGSDHVVQFYQDSSYLIDSVTRFVADAFDEGGTALIIATESHQRALDAALAGAEVSTAQPTKEGRFIRLDAAKALERFMVNGTPDGERFRALIQPLVAGASAAGRSVRAFGEMVAVLWEQGNVTGAIKLEALWNDLIASEPVALMCAYPLGAFDGSVDDSDFGAVCSHHTRVIPAESYTNLSTVDERLLNVALLQQKAVSDAHEREALEAKQQELEEALQRLQELDRARNDFVAMLVHDIRAPMAVIAGLLHILKENWAALDEDSILDLLSRGMSSSKHITKLVNDILMVSQLDAGDFKLDLSAVDVGKLVTRAVGDARDAYPDIRFETLVPEALSPAIGDETRQLQVLNNLLTNAAKFSPAGSTVTVSVSELDEVTSVSVADEGSGISQDDLARLFRRFSRLRQSGYEKVRGTGLGLYISKALVEAQGGSIRVDSQLGRGSTFTYTIPHLR